MKKKGMAIIELLRLILILIIGGILFMAVYKSSAIFSEKGDVEKCRLTILANSQVHESAGVAGNLLGVSKQVPIQCPTTYLEIEGKTLTEQYQTFAEELRACWYKTGEGNLQVFGKDSGDYCLVCSEIKTQDMLQTTRIMEYIKTKNLPKSEITYAQYVGIPENYELFLYKKAGKGGMSTLDRVEKDKEYLLVFVRNANGILYEAANQHFPSLKNIINTKEVQSIAFMPKEDLAASGLCTKLYWERSEKNG